MECVFCQIIAGEQDSFKLYEDENIFAFLDVSPASKGHSLVIPKKHVSDIFEIGDEDLKSVFQGAKKVAEGVREAFDPEGVNIVQSNGEAAGQEIGHFHVHVVPRYEEDEISLDFNPDSLEKGEEIAESIASQLN